MTSDNADVNNNKNKRKQHHPFMEKLGFYKPKPSKGEPTCRDIMHYLLDNNILQEKDLQLAYDTLSSFKKKKKKEEEDVVNLDNNNNNPKEEEVVTANIKNNEIHDKNIQQPNTTTTTTTNTTNYRYRHVALRFYYEGADYTGLAEQVGMDGDESIEKYIFAALKKTNLIQCRATCNYSRCGRTDKGVSSAGQVIALHLKSNIPPSTTFDAEGMTPVQEKDLPKNSIIPITAWVKPKKKKKKKKNDDDDDIRIEKSLNEFSYDKMLNNVLPDNIRILGWCPVSKDFSARFSAMTRTYRYFFVPRKNLNLEKMNLALQHLVGKHDFRNLCKINVEKVYNFERHIHSAKIVPSFTTTNPNHYYYFEIIGQAFLWHQIRCIVTILFLIGRGEEDPSVITELLNISDNPRKPAYPLAPERPLVLHACGYRDLSMIHSSLNLWLVCCDLERQWEEYTLKAARIRNCLNALQQDAIVLTQDVIQFTKGRLEERWKKNKKFLSNNKESFITTKWNDNDSFSSSITTTWKEALAYMESKDVILGPDKLRETLHIPLWKRHLGPTVEEKIELLGNSKRRLYNYEENVVKKRKSKEEDSAFYQHMTSQGGSGI